MSIVKNKNSPLFWDRKLVNKLDVIRRSPIYKDKIRIVFNNIENIQCNLLDIGVGYGILEQIIYLKKQRIKIHGLDFAKNTITKLQKMKIGNFRVSKVNNLNYQNNFFKYVLVLDVFEHISQNEALNLMSKIYKISTNDMRLIVSVPVNENNKDSKSNLHIQKYDFEKLEQQIQKSGFEVTKKYELVAFRTFYRIKSILNVIVKFRKPNLLIIVCKKI